MCTCSREVIDIFLLKKLLCCPFLRHCGRKIFQTLHDYSLAWYLHFHGRFDDLDFVSRSQVYQKYKLQILLCRLLFRFLSTVVLMLYGCFIHKVGHAQYEFCNSGAFSKTIYMFLYGWLNAWACHKL